MFSLIKKVFIILLSFIESLARNLRKCLFSNDEPCMVVPNLVDLNPVELKYNSFMTILDKCTGTCNVLSVKMCASKKQKT